MSDWPTMEILLGQVTIIDIIVKLLIMRSNKYIGDENRSKYF